jgi:hypothetical protein
MSIYKNIKRYNSLYSESWRMSKSFKNMSHKMTQLKYYEQNNSTPEVLQLVKLDSKPFGTTSEKILSEILNLGPRTSTQNDATFNNRKIEIKCARYWAGKNECIWQHLEPDHDYEYVLFGLLDFDKWKVWCITKEKLMGELKDKKIITYQGKQGWWTRKSMILPYLTEINSIEDLKNTIL